VLFLLLVRQVNKKSAIHESNCIYLYHIAETEMQ